jgi:hypothetical protein
MGETVTNPQHESELELTAALSLVAGAEAERRAVVAYLRNRKYSHAYTAAAFQVVADAIEAKKHLEEPKH